MSRILILGGTRNLGHVCAVHLLKAGHSVTTLNRGRTPDELPAGIERLRGDRHDDASMRAAIGSREFDLVLDNTTYNEVEARQAAGVFHGRTGRYVFVSSGQVYLVRENLRRPFREEDYAGAVMGEPPSGTDDHASWLYGIDKRLAEQVFEDAGEVLDFPFTTLRLPMIASERDHYGRIQGYVARLLDGEPLLIPDEPSLPLRHVYVGDVARVVDGLTRSSTGIGSAFNISFGTSMSHREFIDFLRRETDSSSEVVAVDRSALEAADLLPACAPFSGRWMSELVDAKSVSELGAEYTAPGAYLRSIVDDYERRWQGQGIVPPLYDQRSREVEFARGRT